jgi:Fe-S cluster assembly iron-binding protein IscA
LLRLTPQAIDHLTRIRKERGVDSSLVPRFVRASGRLRLTFAKGPETGDRVVDDGRLPAIVASSASDLIDDATIDVRTQEGKSILLVRRRRRATSPASAASTSSAASG